MFNKVLLLIICLNSYITNSKSIMMEGQLTPQSPSWKDKSSLLKSRMLQIDEFQTSDGLLKLPLSYNGDSTWVAKIPIPQYDTIKTVMISLYSDESWFSTNDEIFGKATCSNKRGQENTLFNRIEGMRCSLLTSLSKNKEINYKFLYNNESFIPLPAGALGIIGLGISKNSLPLQINPQSEKFSIYLNKDYRTASYIMFGGVDQTLIENQPPKVIQPLSAKNWTFSMSNFKIVQNPSPFNIKTQQSLAVLDFNDDFIGIPEQYFKEIFNNLKDTCTIESSRKSFLCDCSLLDSMHEFEFTLGKQDLKVPASYIIESFREEGESQQKGDKCRIKIGCITSSSLDPNCIFVSENFENVWVLGSPFLSYFYPLFTYRADSKRADVSFYTAKATVDIRQVLADKLKSEQNSSFMRTLKDLITVAGAFAGLFLIYFLLKKGFAFIIERKKRFYAKYQQEELEEGAEDDESRQQMENDNL